MERIGNSTAALLEAVYDAAASPDRWPVTLSAVASAAGAMGAIMFGFSRSRGLVFEHNGSLDPTSSRIFKDRYTNNAWVLGMSARPVNRLVLSDEIQPTRELRRTPFYDEVLRPQGISRAALCTLKFESDLDVQFSVQRSSVKGDFKQKDLATLRQLIPHLSRAMSISLSLTAGSKRPTCVDSPADLMRCAAFTLDDRGKLINMNSAAEGLLAGDSGLILTRGPVAVPNPVDQARWREAVERILGGELLQTLVLTLAGRRCELVLSALKRGDGRWMRYEPGAAAAILVLAKPLPAPAQCVPRCDALTAAEWRVAKLSAEGLSNVLIAQALDLSLNTVKTHMRHVFQKLRVNRQSQLIVLLNLPRSTQIG